MEFKNISKLVDTRINGLSISATITIGEYMDWFTKNGLDNKLEEQRPVMRSRTANTIRKRLVEDLKSGAVIPPIVLGFAINDAINVVNDGNISQVLNENISKATVIDGMQRSEALREALSGNPDISSNDIRLDIWVTSDAISLIYRMLVLNTGQTPWDVKRQMEVVYKPLIDECRRYVTGIVINVKNNAKRRSNGGEYPASSIVELFLAFSSKKELVNTADKLADDFTRLDVTQMTGTPEISHIFYECLSMMYQFDKSISRYKGDEGDELEGDKFFTGLDLFTNMPAKVGFIVALAQEILGRVGIEKSLEEQNSRLRSIQEGFNTLIDKISIMDEAELKEFLSFGVLNDAIKCLSVKKIGDEQRRFFRTGFEALFKSNCEISNMDVVWRAY